MEMCHPCQQHSIAEIFPLSVLQVSDHRDHPITGFLGSLRVSVTPCLRGRCSDFASGVLLRPPQKQRTYAPSPRSEPGMVLRSQVPNTKYQLPSFKLSMTLGTSARHSQ